MSEARGLVLTGAHIPVLGSSLTPQQRHLTRLFADYRKLAEVHVAYELHSHGEQAAQNFAERLGRRRPPPSRRRAGARPPVRALLGGGAP